MPLIVRTRQELAQAQQPLAGRRLGFVPTMGALHEGHLQLVRTARRHAEHVIVSIFVNPAQFHDPHDLERYPRDESGDIALLRSVGCDVVWFPTPETVYPPGFCTRVELAGPALGWEGASRPGHFCGVATVVARLFGLVRPHIAVFGEKDWQQLQVIRQMVEDLCLPVDIIAAPVVREADGLAMSSRNRLLTAAQRQLAPLFYQALCHSVAQMEAGHTVAEATAQARQFLDASGFETDYIAVTQGRSLTLSDRWGADSRLLAAARLGSVRLLDNVGP